MIRFLLLSESPCFSNGLRHVRNYRAENFGDISMQRHLVVEFPLERLIVKKQQKKNNGILTAK